MDRSGLAARLLATFLDELDEQLRVLDADLLALERNASDAEHLRSVFRVAHTLKGASRAAGVRAIEEVCHALEAACAGARDGGTPLTGSQVALLFAGSDALADAGRLLREGRDASTSPIVAELLKQLRRRDIAGEGAARPTSAPRAEPAPQLVRAPAPAEPATPDVTPSDDPATAVQAPRQRDEQLRIGTRQLDSLITVAGELLGMSETIANRPVAAEAVASAVRSWRTEWRRAAAGYRRSLEHVSASPALVAALASVDDHLARLDRQVGDLSRALGNDARMLGGTTSRLVDGMRRLRMRPFADIAEILPRSARDVAVSLGKEIQVIVEGQEVEADRTVLDALREPLLHLVRNAIDHGVEAPAERLRLGKPAEARIVVRAELGGDRLRVTVSDDGAGLDIASIRESLAARGRTVPGSDHGVARALFDSGFSTREVATAISGRGVGLDIVRTAVERVGGTVDVSWTPGNGTTFTIDAPLSVATLRALLVRAGGQLFAMPTTFVERLARVRREDVRTVEGRRVLISERGPIPLTTLARLLGPPLADPEPTPLLSIIILATGERRIALVVDELVEEREIVVRPLEHAGDETAARFAGAALLDGTRVALVVNAGALASTGERGEILTTGMDFDDAAPEARQAHILVVDDSITTRTLEQSVLGAAGYMVTTAVDGVDAFRLVQEGGIDLVISDVEMPRLDGLGLTEQIRASAAHARLPVILVTSLDKPEERARGLEAGADAYILKSSFDQDTLLGIVRQLLGQPT